MSTRVGFLALAALAACTDDDGADTTSTESAVTGTAVYRDAATDDTGNTREPAAPPPQQDVAFSVKLEGSAWLLDLAPGCLFDPNGRFEAYYGGTLAIGENGACTGALAESSTQLVTQAGCLISDLEVGSVERVVVRAELAPTMTNCETYCEAHGRAEAEHACAAAASAIECRATHAANAAASCRTTCMQRAHRIVAESSLDATVFTGLDADHLRAGALGKLVIDFEFDRMETSRTRSPDIIVTPAGATDHTDPRAPRIPAYHTTSSNALLTAR